MQRHKAGPYEIGSVRQMGLRRSTLLFAALCLAVALVWLAVQQPARRVVHSGTPDIGGTFVLEAADGRLVRETDLVGTPSILYFGAIDDDGLSAAALGMLNAALQRMSLADGVVRVVFITLDPERDTFEGLKSFVGALLPRATVLRGSINEINSLAKKYKLYFKIVTDPLHPKSHIVDHASLYYVLDRRGAYVDHIPYTTDVGELVQSLSVHIR